MKQRRVAVSEEEEEVVDHEKTIPGAPFRNIHERLTRGAYEFDEIRGATVTEPQGGFERRPASAPWRRKWKTISAALTLLFIGVVLTCSGLGTWYSGDREAAIPMFIIGGLTIIPGSYASFNLYGAWASWPEYDWDYLPSYDED